MRKKAIVVCLGTLLVGAVAAAVLSGTVAEQMSPVPEQVSFEAQRHKLQDINHALLAKEFERLAAPRGKDGALPPPAQVNGMTWDDLDEAQAALKQEESAADQARQSAIYARNSLKEDLRTYAGGAILLALVGIMVVSLMTLIQRWKADRRPRGRLTSEGLRLHAVAEKAGLVWGVVERVAVPLRDAFVRGRDRARSK